MAVTSSGSSCAWTATSNDSWITVTSGASGTGSGTVGYTVSANTGRLRVGTISIESETFTVRQGGEQAGSVLDLPKTGQTTCWDTDGTVVDCAGTGQDGEIQAGAAWPDPRFSITYCDASAPCSDQGSDCDSDSTNDVVTDNLTGLMWPRNGNHGQMVWDSAIDYANSYTVCGYSDWHLPNVNELDSLVNAEEANPGSWLNAQGFVNVQSSYYWSATTYAGNTGDAWLVSMWSGYVLYYNKSIIIYYAWPVRAGQ
ncbi:protein of unknown function DUF1566 [Candidatus Magnetoovum chiemensis]|nr:protein of unknown function DUF1566 [Candidatus Magnetoovum chiemensis]